MHKPSEFTALTPILKIFAAIGKLTFIFHNLIDYQTYLNTSDELW